MGGYVEKGFPLYFINDRLFHCLYTNINGQSEAELAERRQRYYTSLLLTINSAGSMMVYCKDQYPFAFVGENLIHFLGYEKEEFHQRILNYIQLCYKPDVAAISRSVESQLAQNDYYEVEYRVQRKDGTPVWMWEKGKRLQEMDGEDILVCVLLDHSRQRRVREYLWEKSVLDPLTM